MRKNKQITVTVYPSTDKLLDRLAELTQKPKSKLLVEAADYALESMIEKAQELQA